MAQLDNLDRSTPATRQRARAIARRTKAIQQQLDRLLTADDDLDLDAPSEALDAATRSNLAEELGSRTEELEFALSLAERETPLRLAEAQQPGSPGLTGYRYSGYATNKDEEREFLPYRARGLNRNLGLYHQAYLDSGAYARGVSKIVEGLTTSHWWISPAEVGDDPVLLARAQAQAKAVHQALLGLEGGWSKHLGEALYGLLVPGFAPFLRVYDEEGRLKALSFRYPSQVARWLTDEHETRIEGIEFAGGLSPDGEGRYSRLAHELVIYQYRAVGNDFEGLAPMRAVYKYIQAHKLFCQLEGVAAEKFGAPLTTVERPAEGSDKADDDALVEDLDDMLATDNPVIILPNGYKVNLSSPNGQMPDLEPAKRYCDEQVTAALTAEGSLIGLNGKGAYNLADVKDDQQLRTLAYYAALICDVVNGLGTPYTGVIRDLVLGLDDPSLAYPLVRGAWPRLCWSLAPEQDDGLVDRAIAAFQSGVLTRTKEDEAWLRQRLKLPALTVNSELADPKTQED